MGGSGGGGSSGQVSHSVYLESVHADWLNNTGADTMTQSITDVMDAALGNSPWTGLAAYNPAADIAAYEAHVAAFRVLLNGLSDTVDWSTLYDHADAEIHGAGDIELLDDVQAYSDMLDDIINTRVLPRFRRGMQDINAVVSSAFPIGEAVIEAFRTRDVAKYSTSLFISARSDVLKATEQMMQIMSHRIAWEEGFVRTSIEANRIKLVALKEEADQNALLAEEDALWDLEIFQYGANVMAAAAGGVASGNKLKTPNKVATTLGGAMSGAAAGAMVGASYGSGGGPYGAAIGAVLGAAMGLLSSS